jgi:hypothetical protein
MELNYRGREILKRKGSLVFSDSQVLSDNAHRDSGLTLGTTPYDRIRYKTYNPRGEM